MARWLECLSEYDFEVVHRPGTKHTNADALSRMPALSVSYHFRRFVRCNRISGCHVGLWMNLLRNKDRTPALGKLFNGWKMIVSLGYFRSTCMSSHTQALWAQSSYLILQNGVLYRRWEDVPCKGLHRRLQSVLPPTLVPVLLEALHSSIRGGHFGTSKTLAKVRERFYWVGQRKDVAAWCSGCLSCASRKPPPAKLRAPLQLDPAVCRCNVWRWILWGPYLKPLEATSIFLLLQITLLNGRKPTQYLTWRQ